MLFMKNYTIIMWQNKCVTYKVVKVDNFHTTFIFMAFKQMSQELHILLCHPNLAGGKIKHDVNYHFYQIHKRNLRKKQNYNTVYISVDLILSNNIIINLEYLREAVLV